jgi:hypothetical protein
MVYGASVMALVVCGLVGVGEVVARGAQEPPADGRFDVFAIGHSLNSDIPDMVAGLWAAERERQGADAPGGLVPFRFKEQFIPGAPLRWQWEERDRAKEKRAPLEPQFRGAYFEEFAKGGWDALVMVDSVPRGVSLMPETRDYAARFAREAAAKSPGVRVLIYEPWHCTRSGTPEGCAYDKAETREFTWRERIDKDAPMWDQLVVDLAKDLSAEKVDASVALIPAARGLGLLADAATRGEVPGFAKIEDFFDDEIHTNPYGKYFVACVHFAVLTGRSPVGLPVDVKDRWGRSYWSTPNWQKKQWPTPADGAVRRMQELAAEIAGIKDAAPKQETKADGE